MPLDDDEDLIRALIDSFKILAEEVQLLSDRKTILEHKLRFAHESYQNLADKYAPADSEVSSTLAKLQLPPDLQASAPDRTGFVPLPLRNQTRSKQQTAVAIRDGRRAAQRLQALGGRTVSSTISGRSMSGTSSNMRLSARPTSLSTVLEQDFTVPGKKSSLLCPFAVQTDSKKLNASESMSRSGSHSNRALTPSDLRDPISHPSADPICAAMYAETTHSPPPSASGSGAKCPIRFLDQHSPEEVARYFETHKHEIPRSHEVCVKRYQRNEDDIKKLDAKYGNLVSMIQGLGQKHQPMLPTNEEEAMEAENRSNERVEQWAKAVSAGEVSKEDATEMEEDEDRASRFDRPLKEVRVGESPSRPWGIQVPFLDAPTEERAASPPPAPVSSEHIPKARGKCPIDYANMAKMERQAIPEMPPPDLNKAAGKCPFGHGQKVESANDAPKAVKPQPVPPPVDQTQAPVFITSDPAQVGKGPQMVFTGPVFIGYPIEQAMTLMQQWKSTQ